MPRERLAADAIEAHLEELAGWRLDEGCLTRGFEFPDFRRAFAFMVAAAFLAEELDHHPDWRNVWNRVEIRLSTHDAGGITELDFELARRIDDLLRP